MASVCCGQGSGRMSQVRGELVAEIDESVRARFAQRYGLAPSDLMLDIERRVIGGDWGSNGYTTLAQADELATHLQLDRGRLLLDIGSGRGWPGLYLAASTGCSAILLDVPAEGLLAARKRAATEGLSARTAQVIATAAHLPLRNGSVDGVTHADVLC